MSNKTTIFFIFTICLLVNQIVSEPSLAQCCNGCTKNNNKNCVYKNACSCISKYYDPAYAQQCTKDKKTVKSYVSAGCKHV
ncbi:unnamed protein product [Meloidogyne enterolobii]|uniref:Uncharacterized protein n=1 Tax=Meloidogyne enterolobii TaxID=390850 RepID=A0ACB1AKI9_MELEN